MEFDKSYSTVEERNHAYENFKASLERIAVRNLEAEGETEFGLTQVKKTTKMACFVCFRVFIACFVFVLVLRPFA